MNKKLIFILLLIIAAFTGIFYFKKNSQKQDLEHLFSSKVVDYKNQGAVSTGSLDLKNLPLINQKALLNFKVDNNKLFGSKINGDITVDGTEVIKFSGQYSIAGRLNGTFNFTSGDLSRDLSGPVNFEIIDNVLSVNYVGNYKNNTKLNFSGDYNFNLKQLSSIAINALNSNFKLIATGNLIDNKLTLKSNVTSDKFNFSYSDQDITINNLEINDEWNIEQNDAGKFTITDDLNFIADSAVLNKISFKNLKLAGKSTEINKYQSLKQAFLHSHKSVLINNSLKVAGINYSDNLKNIELVNSSVNILNNNLKLVAEKYNANFSGVEISADNVAFDINNFNFDPNIFSNTANIVAEKLSVIYKKKSIKTEKLKINNTVKNSQANFTAHYNNFYFKDEDNSLDFVLKNNDVISGDFSIDDSGNFLINTKFNLKDLNLNDISYKNAAVISKVNYSGGNLFNDFDFSIKAQNSFLWDFQYKGLINPKWLDKKLDNSEILQILETNFVLNSKINYLYQNNKDKPVTVNFSINNKKMSEEEFSSFIDPGNQNPQMLLHSVINSQIRYPQEVTNIAELFPFNYLPSAVKFINMISKSIKQENGFNYYNINFIDNSLNINNSNYNFNQNKSSSLDSIHYVA